MAYNGGLWNDRGQSKLIDALNAGKPRREAAEHIFARITSKEEPFRGGVAPGVVERRIGEARIFLLGRYEPRSAERLDITRRIVEQFNQGKRTGFLELAVPR
jgi:hypothetical protein